MSEQPAKIITVSKFEKTTQTPRQAVRIDKTKRTHQPFIFAFAHKMLSVSDVIESTKMKIPNSTVKML